jgi:hypothetical protein
LHINGEVQDIRQIGDVASKVETIQQPPRLLLILADKIKLARHIHYIESLALLSTQAGIAMYYNQADIEALER